MFILFTHIANGQIKNQIIKPGQARSHGMRSGKTVNLPRYELPEVNVKRLLKEDSIERTQGKPFRFGKATDVNVDFFKVASKSKSQDTTVFLYKIASRNAFSINLIFDDFTLAHNASMIIYNEEGSMIYGPVTDRDNPANRVFWTDLIKGESIIVQVTIVGEDKKETSIHIGKIIHGYQNTFAGFGQSAACNRDIACQEGNPWRNEGNSVAMLLLSDGQRFCTGALLNNVCRDLTPNFLTAFHCLDSNQDGTLVDGERNQVSNWVFRFLYESPSCGGGDVTTFQSINGSSFRSAFQQSDFALLLLNTRPTGNVTYAGWSRDNVAATSAAAIHHPNGDVKKISIDNNALTNVAVATTWNTFPFVQCPANTHWQAIFDSPAAGVNAGTVQPGSSGSPIFDQNHRIVGQLHGDFLNNNNNFCANVRGHYGRFDVSWAGGGTNDTRLSNWLDPGNTGAVTTNTSGTLTISSPSLVCTGGATFTLNNVPPGATITWTATPAYLFSQSSGTVPAGGNTISLFALNSTSSGVGTLTANIQGACGNPVQVQSAAFWVSTPLFLVTGPTLVTAGSYNGYSVAPWNQQTPFSLQGVNPNTATWSFPLTSTNGGWSGGGTGSSVGVTAGPLSTIVRAQLSNTCGMGYRNYEVFVQQTNCPPGGCEEPFFVYPNPSSEELTIQLKSADDNSISDIALLNAGGEAVYSVKSKGTKQVNIPVNNYQNGVYYLSITRNGTTTTHHIVINH